MSVMRRFLKTSEGSSAALCARQPSEVVPAEVQHGKTPAWTSFSPECDVLHPQVEEFYPAVLMSDVVKLTASHYFGIVPLHQNRQHQLAYLQTCMALLSSLPTNTGEH